MTERLYYNDSYLFEFDAKVVRVEKAKSHFDVTLDQTAFYPESGGQFSDRGQLDGHDLIEVIGEESGRIIHRMKSWTVAEGGVVHAVIDQDLRLDNMRKHTGQHILSAAFMKTAGVETVGAHLGAEESTIELSIPGLDKASLRETELLANQVIMENQPVTIGYYTREELNGMSVRRIPDREGKLRIVTIGRFDKTACGGTHCRATGEVGPVKIIGCEKIRGRIRIIFLAGRLAVEDYHEKDSVLGNLTKYFTCHYRDLDDSVGNLFARNSDLKKEVASLQKKLLPYEINSLIKNSVEKNNIKIVVDSIENDKAEDLRRLAIGVTQNCRAIAIISNGEIMSISVSNGIEYMASELAKKIAQKFGGRGGGSRSYAQIGNINNISTGEITDYILKLVNDEIN